MDIPPPEPTHTKIIAGSFPSPRLQNLATSYPFIQQVDVVIPSSDSIEAMFSKLDAQFMKGKLGLSNVYEQLADSSVSQERDMEALYLTTGETDDKWCIDPRGVLTLCVTKDTYQRLGLVGSKIPFKGCADKYVIRIPLHDRSESVGMKAKRKKAFQDWDRRREEDGLGKWDVIFRQPPAIDNVNVDKFQRHEIKPQTRKSSLISIPIPSPTWLAWPPKSDSDEMQEWDESMSALFEWVGMACLGAQRLEVNDRVDPYVAVYSPPNPSRLGTITHLRWRGLLSSTFLQSVIDSLTSLSTTVDADPPPSFISITAHAFPASPVTFIPPGAEAGGTGKEAPLRVPRSDAEHCWSLILVPGSSIGRHAGEVQMQEDGGEKTEGEGEGGWVMAESIRKWDMRWG